MIDAEKSQVWLVGGGIASMAAAAFLIRDAAVPGKNVHILEQLDIGGGSRGWRRSPQSPRLRHSRRAGTGGGGLSDALEPSGINSVARRSKDQCASGVSCINERVKTDARARLIDKHHRILDASAYGFNTNDRFELMRVLATPEQLLGSRRIDEMFSDHFFQTNFWQMWRTMFAFQNWHSVIELRRYFLRLVQEFPRMNTISGVRRTKFNQYDSIARPLQRDRKSVV